VWGSFGVGFIYSTNLRLWRRRKVKGLGHHTPTMGGRFLYLDRCQVSRRAFLMALGGRGFQPRELGAVWGECRSLFYAMLL
jgi:hypothetical protein